MKPPPSDWTPPPVPQKHSVTNPVRSPQATWTPPPIVQKPEVAHVPFSIPRNFKITLVASAVILGGFYAAYVFVNREKKDDEVTEANPVFTDWHEEQTQPPPDVAPADIIPAPTAVMELPTAALSEDLTPPIGIDGSSSSTSAALEHADESPVPGRFSCPQGVYHVSLEERVRLSESSNFLTINRGNEVIFSEHFPGYLKKVLWSEGSRYVAIEQEEESPGDSVWIIDLNSGSVIKGPYGEESDLMMRESGAMMMRVATTKWGSGVVAEGGEALAIGWHDASTLLVRLNHFYLPPPDFSRFEILGQSVRLRVEGDTFRMEWPDTVEPGLLTPAGQGQARNHIESVSDSWSEIRSPRLHANQLFSVDRENNNVSFGVFWMERFGANQFVAHVNDVDWSKARIVEDISGGAFAGATSISIPMREGRSHEAMAWNPDAGYSSEAPPWNEQVPPVARKQSNDAIILIAADRKSAEALIALFRKFRDMPESRRDRVSFSPDAKLAGERYPQTRKALIREEDFALLGSEDLRYAINELFARHGAYFGNKDVLAMFVGFEWYRPMITMTFDRIEAELFSEHERENLRILGRLRDRKR